MPPTSSQPTARSAAHPTPSATGEPATDETGLDHVIEDGGIGIIVCCGSGGVGKTTTAAALALRAAEAGRTVAVMTIDPAKRLAQSLGLSALDNTPRPVTGIDTSNGGSLDAMMLDMKRTFDDVVLAHAEPGKAQQILDNPFYQALSSSFAGTQEYMAMEKLGQLRAEGRWDLIVVDTPPSRSALDFLDAPARLGSFLDGRFIRLLTAPARAGGRAGLKVFGMGVQVVTSTLTKILGGQMLTDVQTFVGALDTMFGGFRARADQTYRMLSEPTTAFIVVATPERDALREATYFIDRLLADQMPLAAVVVNRVTTLHADRLTRDRALALAETIGGGNGGGNAGSSGSSGTSGTSGSSGNGSGSVGPRSAMNATALLALHAETAKTRERQLALVERFAVRHDGVDVIQIPAQGADVHDIDTLRTIGSLLADRA